MHRAAFVYYGGKGMIAHRYHKPRHRTIIEPFAGGATYSLKYHKHDVVLYEINERIYAMWMFLKSDASMYWADWIPKKVRPGDTVDGIMDDIGPAPNGLEWYLRSACNIGQMGTNTISNTITSMAAKRWRNNTIDKIKFWHPRINHWVVINKPYTDAMDIEATWFIDPPYCNNAGKRYKFSDINYKDLGIWCLGRRGQVIVCENDGAEWLPFKSIGVKCGTRNECVYYQYTSSDIKIGKGE